MSTMAIDKMLNRAQAGRQTDTGLRPVLYPVARFAYGRSMSSPHHPLSAPRRSWIRWVWPLGLGLILGSSCVTCARLDLEAGGEVVPGSDVRVGVVEVLGAIMDAQEPVRQIRRFARRDDLQALVIRIDSPGGSVAPSQELFSAIRYAAEKKPVVASMGTVAASGGFWAALGADWVVASPGSITGSIGVITQVPDLRGVAEKVDFRIRTFKSGEVKDLGNPLREVTEKDREVFMQLIEDVYDQFVAVTAERRKLSREAVMQVADGRILSGRDALEAGLVDELGGLYTAARRAVTMGQKKESGTETSTQAVEDPTLVYPADPNPSLWDFVQSRVGRNLASALREAVSDGLSEALHGGQGRAPQLR